MPVISLNLTMNFLHNPDLYSAYVNWKEQNLLLGKCEKISVYLSQDGQCNDSAADFF